MRNLNILAFCLIIALCLSCSEEKHYEKGFAISPETETASEKEIDGIAQDTVIIKTRPSGVLLTGYPEYRLTTIYKLNYNERSEHYYTGSNNYYRNYTALGHSKGNQWHSNFMPGLQAVYGYNLVNVSLRNIKTEEHRLLFDKAVLIKTLYIPSFTEDTLYSKPVKRDYYLISAYDEDTNKDGFINFSDLRRFYVFDLNGQKKEALVPKNYSVVSSEYDCANDYMYVFAQLDENKNGQRDETEKIHIFWIDLKNPRNNGKQYD